MWRKCGILLSVSFTLLILTASLPAQTDKTVSAQGEEKKETADIDVVIKGVAAALKEAQEKNVGGFPPLASVEITLSTVVAKEGGAKFKILCVSAGGGISDEGASTIKFKMTPPTTKGGTPGKTLRPERYERALAEALNVAKSGVLAARQNLPQLNTSSIEIEVAFTVKKLGDGGISIEPISIGDLTVGGGVTGKLSKSQVHKLQLIFKN